MVEKYPELPMKRIISPMIGEINEGQYDALDLPYEQMIKTYTQASIPKRRRTQIPAILWAEKFRHYKQKGSEVYKALMDTGFAPSTSLNAVKLLGANDLFITPQLVARGRFDEDVSYTMTYLERVDEVGLENVPKMSRKAAIESEFYIRPIKIREFVYRTEVTQTKFNYASEKKPNRKMDIEVRIWKQSKQPIPESEAFDEWDTARELVTRFPNSDLSALMEAFDDPGMESNNNVIEKVEALGALEMWHGIVRFYVRASGEEYAYNIYSGKRI